MTSKDMFGFAISERESLEDLFVSGAHGDFFTREVDHVGPGLPSILLPVVVTFDCPGADCMRLMRHRLLRSKRVSEHCYLTLDGTPFEAILYRCEYCGSTKALLVRIQNEAKEYTFIKGGEWGPPGHPLSRELLKIAGTAGGLLLKGYRCEMLGIGLGAITYYRRVLELRTTELIEAILATAKTLNSSDEIVNRIEESLRQPSYERRYEAVKDCIPPTLFVAGKNPMNTLYEFISTGVHGDDSECLADARIVREILEVFADRMRQIKMEEGQLRAQMSLAESKLAEKRKDNQIRRTGTPSITITPEPEVPNAEQN